MGGQAGPVVYLGKVLKQEEDFCVVLNIVRFSQKFHRLAEDYRASQLFKILTEP